MVRAFFLSFLFLATPMIGSTTAELVQAESELLQEEPPSTIEKQTPLESKSLLIKTALLLAGIVSALYGTAYVIKKIGGGRYTTSSSEGKIHLIERKYLSPKTSVWLLEVEETSLIVIDSQNGVAVQQLPSETTKKQII